ncbi:hypothetical protein [Pseudofrankia sp. DC12]|uniref:hypothetical protein n=1 Tax=Pseudofrankia sp. DC12 TaxID=683315 RepID=UPI0012F9DAED|nr:hypothetical protein [Pseudofrankia sp. DC12]
MVRLQCSVAARTAPKLSDGPKLLTAIERERRGVGGVGDIEALNVALDPAWPLVGVSVLIVVVGVYLLSVAALGSHAAAPIGNIGFALFCGSMVFMGVIILRQRAHRLEGRLPKFFFSLLLVPSASDLIVVLLLGAPFYVIRPAG